MTYIVKWTDGRTTEHTLEEFRREYAAGHFSSFCMAAEAGSHDYMPIADLIQRVTALSAEEAGNDTVAPGVSQRASSRYRDAYRVARALDGIGAIIKSLAGVLGVVVAIGAALIGSAVTRNITVVVAGIFAGVIVAIPIYILGVLVSAQAQQVKASLDEAVHTSPFLSTAQKASVMSLQ